MKNPVAKNCRKFNKAVVHVDQKKAAKAAAKQARNTLGN